jgi:HEAT repeat protein
MWRLALLGRLVPIRCGLAVTLAILYSAAPAAAQRTYRDPVEGLRAALRSEPGSAAEVAERSRRVRYYVARLRTIGELARALRLPDWRSAELELRQDIARRFVDLVHRAIRAPDPLTRQAVANVVGEFGRGVGPAGETEDRGALMRRLVRDLVQLTRSSQPDAVRTAAARALGRIEAGPRERWVVAQPDRSLYDWMGTNYPNIAPLLVQEPTARLELVPSLAVRTLKSLLEPGNDAVIREAAATGLLSLMRGIPLVQRVGTTYTAVETLGTCQEVVPVAGIGLRGADPVVRRLAARTLQQVASVLKVPLPSPAYTPFRREQLRDLPEYRSGDEERRSEMYDALRRQADASADALRDSLRDSLIRRLGRQEPSLARLLDDRSARVRLQVRRTLIEIVGLWRQEYQGTVEGLPAPRERPPRGPRLPRGTRGPGKGRAPLVWVARKQADRPVNELLRGLDPAVRRLARGITDRYAKIRLESLEFLEQLVRAGASPHPEAVPALIRALSDPDRFVRWAAARTLGWYSREKPAEPDRAVPALAHLLADGDLDVRLIAAATLEIYGPAAGAAVDALIKSTQAGDNEIRQAAMRALLAVGKKGQKAIPTLIGLLTNSEEAVRQAAAETLGQFGPAARAALPALRRALHDSDRNVRRAASEAIVNITAP